MRRFVSMKLRKQWFFCVTTVAQVRARCHAKKMPVDSLRHSFFLPEILAAFLLLLLLLHFNGAGTVFIFLNNYVYGMWR